MDELYRNVHHRFFTRVRELSGDKLATTRVGDDPISFDLTSEAVLEERRDILISAKTAARSNELREQLELLQGLLPDMSHQPNRARVRELAVLLSVPQKVHGRTIFVDELYLNVQHRFFTCVRELSGDKLATTRVGDDQQSSHNHCVRKGRTHRRLGSKTCHQVHAGGDTNPASCAEAGILQAVRALGRRPMQVKVSHTTDNRVERALAQRIARHYE